jgi:hypothetical protein
MDGFGRSRVVRKGPKGLSNFKLKVMGFVFVLLSAYGTAIYQRGMPADYRNADFTQMTISVVLEVMSWMAFPIFAWLLYTGFLHTANLRNYALRLVGLAVVSEVPYDLATSGKLWDMSSQNPVIGLALCLLVLYLLDMVKKRSETRAVVLQLIIVVGGALWMLFLNVGLRFGLMPGGVLLLAFVLVFWYLSKRENTMMMVGALIGAIAVVMPAAGFIILHYHNNELGMQPKTKWAFYALYPAALLLIGFAGITLG